MHRTLASFLFDEARLLLSPPHTDNVLASPPEDPLVYYHLYPIIWAFAIVIGLLTWFGRCVLAGRIMLLQDLAKIHPEDRNEFIRKRCRTSTGIKMRRTYSLRWYSRRQSTSYDEKLGKDVEC
jgi:hypothetical protein